MKKLFLLAPLFLFCTGATCWKPVARGALDLVEYTCLFEHDEIQDEKVLSALCNISEDLIPEVRKVLAAKKAAAEKKAAAHKGK